MFKKKEVANKSSHDDIPTRVVKKGAANKDYTSYEGLPARPSSQQTAASSKTTSRGSDNTISDREISESYIPPSKNQRQTDSAPNSSKGNRKKFAPFFLSRKKKNQTEHRTYENVDEFPYEDDITEIASYDDLVAEQQSINPVILGRLDDSELNKIEEETCADDEVFKKRVEYIINNYRKPPPYPGKAVEGGGKALNQGAMKHPHDMDNTPLLRQLLNDKQLSNSNDNASMNNFWQLSPTHTHTQPQKPGVMAELMVNDKLVDRTNNNVALKNKSSHHTELPAILNAGELYEQRRQYYAETLSNYDQPYAQSLVDVTMQEAIKEYRQQDSLSEIYPERDYEVGDPGSRVNGLSASVPDLSQRPTTVRDRNRYLQQRAQMQPGELEALIAHYRKTSLDAFEPYNRDSSASESVSLYSEGSYVPPSPYLNAVIPEWLQIYAKATPELDKYLKWEMFRYPELDCWQTMMKRLYKKEVEQVVLQYEEYRHKLQQELQSRCMMFR